MFHFRRKKADRAVDRFLAAASAGGIETPPAEEALLREYVSGRITTRQYYEGCGFVVADDDGPFGCHIIGVRKEENKHD